MLDLENITSNNMNSLTEENYLKAIFHLLDSENQVTVNELKQIFTNQNAFCKQHDEKVCRQKLGYLRDL